MEQNGEVYDGLSKEELNKIKDEVQRQKKCKEAHQYDWTESEWPWSDNSESRASKRVYKAASGWLKDLPMGLYYPDSKDAIKKKLNHKYRES